MKGILYIYRIWQFHMWSSWDDYQDKKGMPNKIEDLSDPKKGLQCTFRGFWKESFRWIESLIFNGRWKVKLCCWFPWSPVFVSRPINGDLWKKLSRFPKQDLQLPIQALPVPPCCLWCTIQIQKNLLVSGEENCHDKITSFCVNLLHFMQAQGSSLTCLPTNLMPPACCVTYTFGGGWTS